MTNRYRMYIDESGSDSLKSCHIQEERYLGLTGIIIQEDYAKTNLREKFNTFKEFFFDTKEIILHRKEIIKKERDFRILHNPIIKKNFDNELLKLLQKANYVVVSVGIDKLILREKYEASLNPYHYCFEVLLERFYWWLKSKHAVGDMMIEARCKKKDKKLKNVYSAFYNNGTEYITKPSELQAFLTTKELKISPKNPFLNGLEIADLIANPSLHKGMKKIIGKQASNSFGDKVYNILEDSKFYRNSNGVIDGYGIKYLP